jgi:hypothetical protein
MADARLASGAQPTMIRSTAATQLSLLSIQGRRRDTTARDLLQGKRSSIRPRASAAIAKRSAAEERRFNYADSMAPCHGVEEGKRRTGASSACTRASRKAGGIRDQTSRHRVTKVGIFDNFTACRESLSTGFLRGDGRVGERQGGGGGCGYGRTSGKGSRAGAAARCRAQGVGGTEHDAICALQAAKGRATAWWPMGLRGRTGGNLR